MKATWTAAIPIFLTALLISLLDSATVRASLGGGPLPGHGLEKILDQKTYSLHEITLNGAEVREYLLPSGKVFAIAWHGTTEPDLSTLLGEYFDTYQKAQTQGRLKKKRTRGTRVVRLQNFVLERGGHQRDVHGRAYLPGMLPKGLEPEDIK